VVVDISNLVAAYAGRIVLKLERLTIEDGQHTLVLGPSGCGKTTLLNIVAGLSSSQSGQIRICGTDIGPLVATARDAFRGRHIGFVMQRLHLIKALTVRDNLDLAQRLANGTADSTRSSALLTSLGVGERARSYPRELSQGEAQRVAIARAIINAPALILADEPTSALDDANCEAAMDLLFAQATGHKATLLIATHDHRIRHRFDHVLQLDSAAT